MHELAFTFALLLFTGGVIGAFWIAGSFGDKAAAEHVRLLRDATPPHPSGPRFIAGAQWTDDTGRPG